MTGIFTLHINAKNTKYTHHAGRLNLKRGLKMGKFKYLSSINILAAFLLFGCSPDSEPEYDPELDYKARHTAEKRLIRKWSPEVCGKLVRSDFQAFQIVHENVKLINRVQIQDEMYDRYIISVLFEDDQRVAQYGNVLNKDGSILGGTPLNSLAIEKTPEILDADIQNLYVKYQMEMEFGKRCIKEGYFEGFYEKLELW